ncbi:MAG: LptF/LptG family permease [Armatimonadetes bacterium]|nr:LptF/LptG family permease [Armatimonadota bacterium]
MKRMDRYLLGEMLLPFVSGVLLIIVMLVGNTVFPLIEQIAKYGIPLMVVAKLVAFNLPTLLVLTLPAATALAAAWAVNRLARDSEVTAIRMSGVPLRRLFRPIFFLGAAASLLAFVVGDRVVPPATQEFYQTQSQLPAFGFQALPSVAANKVFTFQDYSFHIREIHQDPGGDVNKLHLVGVTIFQNPPIGAGFPVLYTAQSATYDHDLWTLYQVHIDVMDADGSVAKEVAAGSLVKSLRIPLGSLEQSATRTPEMLTMRQLGTEMRALASTGQRGTDAYNAIAYNYYTKLALPFICLAFALFAPPLTLRFARQGAYTGIFLSILMVWVAWNTLILGKFLGASGKLSPVLAAWAPDVLFMALGLLFLWRME